LSSLVSDLLGASARRMLKALAEGETNPAALAALADWKLRATPEQLCDALGACTDLKSVYRRLLQMALEQLQFLEQQIDRLDQELACLLPKAVAEHGDLRRKQGYTVAMAVEESRLLQVTIFTTLQKNTNDLEFSTLLPDVVIIADEGRCAIEGADAAVHGRGFRRAGQRQVIHNLV